VKIMTNDSPKPETAGDSAKTETFRSHLPAVVAATAGTVTAAVLGSLLGTAGTIVGMAIASLTAGTLSWWAERGIRRSAAMATARAGTIRARGRHLHADEDAVVTVAVARSTGRHLHADDDDAVPAGTARQARGWPRRRWAVPVAIAAAAFIGCAVPLTLLEHAAGKPLSAIVQGEPGHGTTLGGGAVGKPAPSRTPSPSPSPTGSAATAAASSTAPGSAASSPAASPTPAGTASGTTSPSPASSASDSPTPSAAPTTPAPG
jgi:hypothetical protein